MEFDAQTVPARRCREQLLDYTLLTLHSFILLKNFPKRVSIVADKINDSSFTNLALSHSYRN